MAGALHKFYLKKGWQYLERSLRAIVGRSSEYAVEEALFRKHVIESGWTTLPPAPRKLGRERLRWDDILMALRRDVYQVQTGKLLLRTDCRKKIAMVLRQTLGANAAGRPRPVKAAPIAGPVRTAAPNLATHSTPVPQRTGRPTAAAGAAVGIDLGTAFCRIAHVNAQGRPISIPNVAGSLLTPSIVFVAPDHVLAGLAAVPYAARDRQRTADAIKRDLGAKNYHRDINGWDLPPEAIAAFLFRTLKADAEKKLGPVARAVLTVPAHFDEKRRQAMLTAGTLVDLEVLDVLNEPTAAALAWAYRHGLLDRQGHGTAPRTVRLLIYDLGATFSATVLEMHGSAFRTLASESDVYLGGADWDEALANFAADQLVHQAGADPRHHPGAMSELLVSAETAKRALTERPKAGLFVIMLGRRLRVEVTRQDFENVTAPLLARTRTLTQSAVLQAGLDWPQIDKIILVGGGVRMPMVVRLLHELTGDVPDRSLSPDEAVAHGAALYADLLAHRSATGGSQARLLPLRSTARSLGIVGVEGSTGRRRNQILIPKNTPLPCTVTVTFKTSRPNQRRVTIRAVEGESEDLGECTPIGFYTVNDLPPDLPAGWPVHVSYTYHEDGQLQVQAQVDGHASPVATKFQSHDSLPSDAKKRWNRYIKRGTKKRKK
jgi:molecular chaperone DnaK